MFKMGSTATPIKRQRSVKFQIKDNPTKPSIKITVSSDAIAEKLLKNNVGVSSSNPDDNHEENNAQQPQPALIQIVGNCCKSKGDGGGNIGVTGSPTNKVLCTCSNGGDDKRTRIALDDFTVLEFPNCIDFGIKDFLCCKDEIELDLSSDTDASFLDATPPHRFSDSELENQIEAMSITLDTQLNPYPDRSPFILSKSGVDDDEDEEETTEESFIMDEEEVSSSASNSAATICGDGGANLAELEDHEDDDNRPLVYSSDDLMIEGDIDMELEKQHESIKAINDHAEIAQPINETVGSDGNDNGISSHPITISQDQLPEKIAEANGLDVETNETAVSHQSPELEDLIESQGECTKQSINGSRKALKHPTKQFRRQISLPASFFMTYLLEQNNKANYCKQNNHPRHQKNNNCEIISKNKLNRSNSYKQRSTPPVTMSNSKVGGIVIELQPPAPSPPPLSPAKKIDFFRSNKVIHGSTEDYDEDEMNISNSFSDTNEDYLVGGEEKDDMFLGCDNSDSNWTSAWESKSDSFTTDAANNDENDPHELEFGDEQQAFTSDVEKKSLILRHVRRLIRQDTTGNFAPPDFSI